MKKALLVLALLVVGGMVFAADWNPADINDDGKVDLRDVYTVAKAFGSYEGHERWNPAADLNGDGKIDLRDIYTVAKNFGKVKE